MARQCASDRLLPLCAASLVSKVWGASAQHTLARAAVTQALGPHAAEPNELLQNPEQHHARHDATEDVVAGQVDGTAPEGWRRKRGAAQPFSRA